MAKPMFDRTIISIGALVAISALTLAGASIILSYTTSSAVDVEVKQPPIQWAAGPDATGNPYTSDWTLSANATSFSVTLKPVPEATVTWGNLTNLRNADESSVTNVVVRASSVAAYPELEVARAEFYDFAAPDVLAGQLDLTAAEPTLDLGAMSAGERYFVKLVIRTASGAGQQDMPDALTFHVDVTP